MSFFGKLKDRLFKSSSKLDEGLEAIVEDGGEIAAPDPDVTPGPETACSASAIPSDGRGNGSNVNAPR